MRIYGVPGSGPAVSVGGLLSALGAGCFVVNLWVTIDASPMSAVRQRAPARDYLSATSPSANRYSTPSSAKSATSRRSPRPITLK